MEEFLKAIPVYLSCIFKFIFGPIGGFAAGLNIFTTIVVTILGMMTAVVVITFSGPPLKEKLIKRFFAKSKKFSKRNRRFVRIWKKYGLAGVAALTPILLTPIGGTLMAVGVGSPKGKIILYMFISACVWSVAFSSLMYYFGNQVLLDLIN